MVKLSDGPAGPIPPPPNSAFVFVKPHAVTPATEALVTKTLESKGITITASGSLTSEVIDEKKLIDQHYYAIASKATILKPVDLNVPADKFKSQFGLDWTEALATGKVRTLVQSQSPPQHANPSISCQIARAYHAAQSPGRTRLLSNTGVKRH